MQHERVGTFRVEVPTTRRERMRGFRDRRSQDPRGCMLFRRCRSVHTFGMAFPIDVVLLDARQRPIRTVRLAPNRMLLPKRRVRHVMEVVAGQGDALCEALAARSVPAR